MWELTGHVRRLNMEAPGPPAVLRRRLPLPVGGRPGRDLGGRVSLHLADIEEYQEWPLTDQHFDAISTAALGHAGPPGDFDPTPEGGEAAANEHTRLRPDPGGGGTTARTARSSIGGLKPRGTAPRSPGSSARWLPTRSPASSSSRAGRAATRRDLAGSILRSGSFERIGRLGELLAANGFADQVMLDHCREPAESHQPGCWLLDAVLGRG